MRWVCLAAAVCAFGCNPPPNNPAPPQKNGEAEGRPQPAEPARAGLNQPTTIGWLTVTVTSAAIKKPELKGIFGDTSEAKDEELVIAIKLAVSDPRKKYDYMRWTDRFSAKAKLTDDAGNTYRAIDYGAGAEVAGAVSGTVAVTSETPQTDVLIFEKPTPGAREFYLELKELDIGKDAVFRFRIPRPGK